MSYVQGFKGNKDANHIMTFLIPRKVSRHNKMYSSAYVQQIGPLKGTIFRPYQNKPTKGPLSNGVGRWGVRDYDILYSTLGRVGHR